MSFAPRRRRSNSVSFPRLRSQPIQQFSDAFQRLRRWNRRKRGLPSGAGPCRSFRSAIAARAAASAASSPLSVSSRRVGPVGQEREVDEPFRVGEEAHLELFDLARRLALGSEHRRNDDDRGHLLRNPLLERELRQSPRPEQLRDVQVQDRDGDLRRRNEREKGEDRRDRSGHAESDRRRDRQGRHQEREKHDRRGVAGDGPAHPCPPHELAQGRPVTELSLELRPAPRDQVVAGIRPDLSGRLARGRVLGRAASDLLLGEPAALRELLDAVAVAVARREIHVRDVRPAAQLALDQAHALEEVPPVDGREQPHARDDVAHRDVERRLLPVLGRDQLVAVHARARDPFLDPAQRRNLLRIVIAKALDELNHECRLQPIVRGETDGALALRIRLLDEDRVGERIRGLLLGAAHDDRLGETPQVLREHQAQRDGERPQLADRERLDVLIGRDEASQRLDVDPAVRVLDVGPGDAVDPRSARESAVQELGELAVEARRQVVANLPQLLVDDVVVVREPLGGGRDRPALADRLRNLAVAREQDAGVLFEPLEEPRAPPLAFGDAVGSPELGRALVEPVRAQEVAADRRELPGVEASALRGPRGAETRWTGARRFRFGAPSTAPIAERAWWHSLRHPAARPEPPVEGFRRRAGVRVSACSVGNTRTFISKAGAVPRESGSS